VLWRLIKASAIVAAVGLALAGCAVQPLKMGAAAIVGSQRISVATLGVESANLGQAAKKYPGVVTLSQTEVTQATLTWLIRYQIQEELARQNGITVSPAQANAALQSAVKTAEESAESQGATDVSQELILVASGVPPSTSAQLGRYEAIANMYLAMVNGGKLPTTSSAQTAAGDKLTKAQCRAAKSLNIQVNPQFGQLDYTALQVVSAPSTVTRSAGPTTSASPVATAPAC
jgi:3-deoxy-D-manno-octulosonate 8-phosphate phosphatase KdsC-like HAD superfamily phosphatase